MLMLMFLLIVWVIVGRFFIVVGILIMMFGFVGVFVAGRVVVYGDEVYG